MQIPKSKNTEVEIRVLEIAIAPVGAHYFDIASTFVKIEDEGTGEYLKVYQRTDSAKPGEIYLNVEEWEDVKKAIDFMAANVRTE